MCTPRQYLHSSPPPAQPYLAAGLTVEWLFALAVNALAESNYREHDCAGASCQVCSRVDATRRWIFGFSSLIAQRLFRLPPVGKFFGRAAQSWLATITPFTLKVQLTV